MRISTLDILDELGLENNDENYKIAIQHGLEKKLYREFTETNIQNEYTLQNACVEWCRNQHTHLLFTATCGGLGSQKLSKKMNKQGYLKGIPDILFLNGFAIEMKWKKGGLREEQKNVIKKMQDMGWTVFVLRTPLEFIFTIERRILPHWYILHRNSNALAKDFVESLDKNRVEGDDKRNDGNDDNVFIERNGFRNTNGTDSFAGGNEHEQKDDN